MIAVTLIMLDLMTQQNAGTLMVSFCFKQFTLFCDTGDTIMDAGIRNNDMGYGTGIGKLGMQMMTLQNDKMKVGFCRQPSTSTLYKRGYVNMH